MENNMEHEMETGGINIAARLAVRTCVEPSTVLAIVGDAWFERAERPKQ